MDRSSLDKDSSLGISWSVGESVVELALKRLEGIEGSLPLDFNIGVVSEPILNAVASSTRGSYLAAIFWPLPLTIQGVAAAIWANPSVAPWIGNVSRLNKRVEFDSPFPLGFDLFLAQQGKIDFEPAMFRSGVRIDDVEAIVSAGEDRWEAFLATWMSALRFVWGHELAHVLYGHVDLVSKEFGIAELYENRRASLKWIPESLSQYMELVADVDSAMHIFGPFYNNFFSDEVSIDATDYLNAGAAMTLGIVISIYVLWQEEAALMNDGASNYNSHPPIHHRAGWVLSGESRYLDNTGIAKIRKRAKKIEAFRKASIRLLRTVAEVHESLNYWIRRIDDSAEDTMNEYMTKIHTGCEAYHDAMDRVQKVRNTPR